MAEPVGSEQTGSITATSRVDQAADELYALPPAEFTAARARLVAAAEDKEVAKAIGALRRPTLAAWAVNRVVRGGAPEVEEALELGERLRDAQRQLHGSELRRLDVRRRELVGELTSLAASGVGGLTGEALQQVRNTFVAALADASLASEVRGGRLVKALEYSGFGPVGVADDLSERREVRRERRLREAREAVESAVERVGECSGEVKAARVERDRRVRELGEVRAALRAAERGVEVAGRVLEKAEQRLESAEDARVAAEAAVGELER